MSKEFDEKVVLITGATSGIGLATAKHMANQGATVVAAARNADRGNVIQKTLGKTSIFVATDVTQSEDVDKLCNLIQERWGKLDYAFNNAGIFVHEPAFNEHDSEMWQQIMTANLTSVYLCMKAELNLMLPMKQGRIVNNASIVGHRGSAASGPAYTAAKHGVLGLARQAAATYAASGIRINTISPGPTLTAATEAGLQSTPENVRKKLSALNPTGELIGTEDIAAAVAYLFSDAARMINGQDIALDGGQLAKL